MRGLREKHRTGLLYLPDAKPFQANLKELDLYPLPLPTLLAFAIIELDVLHALYQLYHLALFQSGLVEPLDIKFPPITKSMPHIRHYL